MAMSPMPPGHEPSGPCSRQPNGTTSSTCSRRAQALGHVGSREVGLHHVLDVGEVAGLQPVPVDHRRLARQLQGLVQPLARLVFPFAMGVCDVISGDVAIFRDTGIFDAHILAHEFTHRKGYWKELHAQVLSYLALVHSGDPLLVQAGLAERLAAIEPVLPLIWGVAGVQVSPSSRICIV